VDKDVRVLPDVGTALKGGVMLIREVVDLFISYRKNNLNVAAETVKAYRYAAKHFIEFMEDARKKTSYEEISRVDIAAFNEYMKGELDAARWSRSRFLLIIKTLKAMFRWIEEDDECKEDGLKSWRTKMPKGGKYPRREYIPSVADLKSWQKAFNTKTATGLRDYMIFTMLLETGMRRGELAGLKEENVMFGTQTIYISDGKTGARTISMSPLLAELIKTYLKKRSRSHLAKSPYLFPSKRASEQPTDAQYVSQIFRRIKKKLGLANITPHTLRHAFSTYYLVNGGGSETLRVNTGHKTYDSMLHYMHLAKVHGKHQKDEMEKASLLKMLRAS
jgi:site-specific recombinase XerD